MCMSVVCWQNNYNIHTYIRILKKKTITPTHRQTDKQTDRKTDRQTQTDTDTDRHTHNTLTHTHTHTHTYTLVFANEGCPSAVCLSVWKRKTFYVYITFHMYLSTHIRCVCMYVYVHIWTKLHQLVVAYSLCLPLPNQLLCSLA